MMAYGYIGYYQPREKHFGIQHCDLLSESGDQNYDLETGNHPKMTHFHEQLAKTLEDMVRCGPLLYMSTKIVTKSTRDSHST